MKPLEKILFFFLLPVIALISYPPNMLFSAIGVVVVVVAGFLLLGWALMRGKSVALTFTIFVQGLNVIIRIMMFFSHAVPAHQSLDITYVVFNLIGLCLSFYLMLRLDERDVRLTMIA
jgi:hypothetical protein